METIEGECTAVSSFQIPKMQQTHKWTGKYRDVVIEVVNWGDYPTPFCNWNYYLHIFKKNVPEHVWTLLEAIKPYDVNEFLRNYRNLNLTEYPERMVLNYGDSFLADVEWHGGITFCEFTYSQVKEVALVKVQAGCDYGHLHDEYREYHMEDILADAMATVDDFLRIVSGIEPPQKLLENRNE